MEKQKDLFTELALKTGCSFISDLRVTPFNEQARELLASYINLQEYSLNVLSDVYDYLYGVKVTFETYDEAQTAFATTKKAPSANK